MVSYEVTATMDPALADAYERYMRERHIPEVLSTGCFAGAAFAKLAPGRYRARYDAPGDAELERYLTQCAPGLREDFAAHFPSGVALSREVWSLVQTWDRQQGREVV